jgi:EAL domain-containing protein (putative c-di-GMP-specific phosphodiesterase class I)
VQAAHGQWRILAAAAFREATSDIHIASELTERMLEIVARNSREWADNALPVEHIGINVSLADFHGGRLDQQIAAAHALHGLALEHLVIEISESAYPALRDQSVISSIQRLREQGCGLRSTTSERAAACLCRC